MKKIILFFLLMILCIGMVSAAGDSFETAETITPGTIEGSLLERDSVDFYQINLNPGQRLTVKSTFESDEDSVWAEMYLYSSDRQELKSAWDFETAPLVLESHYVANEDLEGIFYIRLKLGASYPVNKYALEVNVEENADMGSGDASATFDDAMPITNGSFPNCCWLVAGKSGKDEKDFYKMDLKTNDFIKVKLTPGTDEVQTAQLNLAIYDSSRTKKVSEEADNEGQIITVEYHNIGDPQTVYIAALRDTYYTKGGPYGLDVILENRAPAVCVAEQKKCFGDDLKICSDDLTDWDTLKTCDDGCVPASWGDAARCADKGESVTTTADIEKTNKAAAGAAAGFLGVMALMAILPIIIGIYLLISLICAIICIVSIASAGNDGGWKTLWILIVIFLGLIGCIIYWIAGKKKRIDKNSAMAGMSTATTTQQPQQSVSQPTQPAADPQVAQLKNYVSSARAAGKSNDQIKTELRNAGWPDDKINQAL